MPTDLPKAYRPSDHEARIRALWDASGAFHADPARVDRAAPPGHGAGRRPPYAIVIPPPNVTAALHLGHALNNTIQDVLTRAHRMMGYEALWMPGTDHAGIATQTVVEKRLIKEEGRRRNQYEREEFVAKVQAFKDEYERVITGQLKALGCSCDWERQRFTMDDVCARAVREAFFRLFRDGLIYRGKRLVNWDPVTQTVLADDEVDMVEVDGHFYSLRYPLCDAQGAPISVRIKRVTATGVEGEEDATHVTVATTRPETYLGDTAVAVSPRDPRWPALEKAGAHVRLPFVKDRIIPIIADDYVVLPAALHADPEAAKKDPKAAMATGFLKVTPAHDPNDWEIAARHSRNPRQLWTATWIERPALQQVINVMAPDASISDRHGWTDIGEAKRFIGLTREAAREAVVAAFREAGLLGDIRPHRHSVGHSYRSHVPIEPYLSEQWYIDVKRPIPSLSDEGMIDGTDIARHSLAGLALSALLDDSLEFTPDRYSKTYQTWLENLRDWPISRQLWWGHRIPVWTVRPDLAKASSPFPNYAESEEAERDFLDKFRSRLAAYCDAWGARDCITLLNWAPEVSLEGRGDLLLYLCAQPDTGDKAMAYLQAFNQNNASLGDASVAKAALAVREMLVPEGFVQDSDVLDTWFSSGLWPLSTMGWPDESQAPEFDGLLEAFNPTDVLTTAREIITLWVSRMVMFNRYLLARDGRPGPIPFRDVFIHAMIQDGEGRKMSKSLGNGVDPLDIIHTHGADAMRYTLCHMTTQTQDVRMPVEPDPATGKNTSPKFDLGRNFCNKLWNAARFAIAILEESPPTPAGPGEGRTLAERWMLSRLESTVREVNTALKGYEFSVYAQAVYDLLWRDFCDWYLEAIKPTVREDTPVGASQRAVLRASLDAILRLLHPACPFITEAIHERLRELPAPEVPGLDLPPSELLCSAAWPVVSGDLRDEEAERRFERVRGLVGAIREARAQQNVPPKRRLTLHLAPGASALAGELAAAGGLVETLAGLEQITADAAPAGVTSPVPFEAAEHRLSGLVDSGGDSGAEKARLAKMLEDLEKSIGALEGRLNNPGYAARAPAHLVQQTREQLAGAVAERDTVRAALERLG